MLLAVAAIVGALAHHAHRPAALAAALVGGQYAAHAAAGGTLNLAHVGPRMITFHLAAAAVCALFITLGEFTLACASRVVRASTVVFGPTAQLRHVVSGYAAPLPPRVWLLPALGRAPPY